MDYLDDVFSEECLGAYSKESVGLIIAGTIGAVILMAMVQNGIDMNKAKNILKNNEEAISKELQKILDIDKKYKAIFKTKFKQFLTSKKVDKSIIDTIVFSPNITIEEFTKNQKLFIKSIKDKTISSNYFEFKINKTLLDGNDNLDKEEIVMDLEEKLENLFVEFIKSLDKEDYTNAIRIDGVTFSSNTVGFIGIVGYKFDMFKYK